VIRIDIDLPLDAFDLNLAVELKASVTALYGPSGAGKTSLLEAVAGLRQPRRAEISIGEEVLFSSRTGVSLPPERRRVGYVPQDVLLFPHLSVRRNIGYGARRSSEKRLTFETIAEALEIAPLADRSPARISGGERQRVALGRALMSDPRLLLLDEPLAALDLGLKERILPYLRRVQQVFQIPAVYVTHDVRDVLTFCDEVLVVDRGQRVAQGPPAQVLAERNVMQRVLAGPIDNVFEAEVTASDVEKGMTHVQTSSGLALWMPFSTDPAGTRLRLGVLAEDILVGVDSPGRLSARNVLPGRIESIETFDGVVLLRVRAGELFIVRLTRGAVENLHLEPGGSVYLIIKTHSLHRLG
jgi:molybdate transport system ATP-binding protein